jgi:hypothetical protein
MPKNLIIITSVINIPNLPFSYTDVRSKYTREERFEQTKYTIQTIKNKIPESEILLIECSDLNNEEITYIKNNVTHFLNIYNSEFNPQINVFGQSKSLGENTLIVYAIDYLCNNCISFDNLYKMSGRYWLNDNFNYDNFDNDKIVYKTTENNELDVFTSFYKLSNKHLTSYMNFINNNVELLNECICAEIFFGIYLTIIEENEKKNIPIVGVSGFIAVWDNCYLEY